MLIIRNVELADFGCWSLEVLLREKKMSDLVSQPSTSRSAVKLGMLGVQPGYQGEQTQP